MRMVTAENFILDLNRQKIVRRRAEVSNLLDQILQILDKVVRKFVLHVVSYSISVLKNERKSRTRTRLPRIDGWIARRCLRTLRYLHRVLD